MEAAPAITCAQPLSRGARMHVNIDLLRGNAHDIDRKQSIPELEAQITELAGHLNSANYRLLALIAEFDRRQGWGNSGTRSCAHWLNWKCGIELGAAREKVRAARALEMLPRVSAAMARGELSYSKVRALTRVASPATEELLLMIALHGNTHHLETTVRCFRRAQQEEELTREAQQHAARCISWFYDETGMLNFRGSLPAEAGALFVKAVNGAIEAQDRGGVSAESSPSRCDSPAGESPTPGERSSLGARRADALARIAESYLAHGAEVLSGGDRHQIIVHVDAQTLREGGDGRCEHEDGPALPVETALRRALSSRDRGCRFPGCPNKHYVDGHHIEHWACAAPRQVLTHSATRERQRAGVSLFAATA